MRVAPDSTCNVDIQGVGIRLRLMQSNGCTLTPSTSLPAIFQMFPTIFQYVWRRVPLEINTDLQRMASLPANATHGSVPTEREQIQDFIQRVCDTFKNGARSS